MSLILDNNLQMYVRLGTKWFWIRVQLQSIIHKTGELNLLKDIK